MAKRPTKFQPSGQAMFYNFLLNEVLASQLGSNYEFWVVAPWVIDFQLPHPFYVSFQEVVETKQDSLYLFDVLHQISANGGKVYIVVGSDFNHYPELKQLSKRNNRIQIRMLSTLHAKAYVGRYGALTGSLNLTNNGMNKNDELSDYCHDERSIAQLRQLCIQFFDQAVQLS